MEKWAEEQVVLGPLAGPQPGAAIWQEVEPENQRA